MIRIAFLIDTIACDTAGTQRQLLETIRRLDRRSFEPHLICLWKSVWMEENELPCPVTILQYNGFISLGFFGVIRRFLKLIARKRFHIIQTFFEDSIFVGFFGALLGQPRPVLLSSRRDMGLGDQNQPWYHKLYGLALPLVNKKFAGIIANSLKVKEYVADREKTSPDKIKVIGNGVEIPAPPDQPPSLFTDCERTVWVGIAASLTPVKRHDVLLRALAKVVQSDPASTIQAVILGDGPERPRLENMAAQLNISGIVHFEGAVADVSAYLHQAHIGVLCSDREGLPNAILEYMACSLPVVTTTAGGSVELVGPENGICVPVGDPDALALALVELYASEDRRIQMGQASFRKISQTYSWDKTMAAQERYYRDMIAEHCSWDKEGTG